MTAADAMLTLQIEQKQTLAEGIARFVLVDPTGASLPGFTAGAHIDVHLPDGLTRQYSLCNSPAESNRYVLGVQLTPNSRGGSRQMHAYEVGTLLSVSEPRNHFPLVTPDGMLSVLVAGGIGITPMLSMAYALHERGEIFQLHYCVRNKARVAFHEELRRTPFADKMRLYVDDMPAAHFSPDSLAVSLSPEAHLYVCGPGPFMDAVLGAARMRGIADSHLHREYFSAPAATASKLSEPTASFIVRVASTGDNISVAPNESVATALARAGFDVPLSCGQGVCGTCRTRVLSGIPDHHDICLDDAERASNAWFTPCCSRSLTPVLEIDL